MVVDFIADTCRDNFDCGGFKMLKSTKLTKQNEIRYRNIRKMKVAVCLELTQYINWMNVRMLCSLFS